MKYIIILFFLSLIVSFSVLSSKYKNPYKLYFIFGRKGSGKSTLMVNKLFHYMKKGYIVYTDMNVNIPGVRIIDPNDLQDHWPEQNCAIFIDEAQLYWDNRQFKNFAKGFLEFFSFQRKCKAVLFMNSQSFDIDKKIRDRADGLILQSNIGNFISVSRPILKKIVLTEATSDSESRISENLSFDKFWHFKFYYMPKYWQYFDSFELPYRPPLPYKEVPQTEVIVKNQRVFFRRKKARPADSGSVQPLDTDCLTTTKQSVTEDERLLTDFTPILYNESVQGFGQ